MTLRAFPTCLDSERLVLGGCINPWPELAATAVDTLTGTEFSTNDHGMIFDAVRDLVAGGTQPDVAVVTAELRRRNQTLREPGYLLELFTGYGSPRSFDHHLRLVVEYDARRRLLAGLGETIDLAYDTASDFAVALGRLDQLRSDATMPVAVDGPDDDLGVFLESDDDYDWVVPGLLERRDRLMITAGEGVGKSLMLRQLAVQIASGTVPFSQAPMTPQKVMVVDTENSVAGARRSFRQLADIAAQAQRPVMPGMLIPLVRPGGLDLLSRNDSMWLYERCEANRPDIICIGPLYKLHAGNPHDEEPAKATSAVLDRVRDRYGAALVIEAHSPHDTTSRPGRPFGASLWMRWPEFGFTIQKEREGGYRFLAWRGPRDERSWPTKLTKKGRWLWNAA